MALFAPKCPVGLQERLWIEEWLPWLVGEFGVDVLSRPVVLPTPDYFPGPYTDDEQGARDVVRVVGRHLAVDPERVVLEMFDDQDDEALLAHLPVYEKTSKAAAAHYRRDGDRVVIAIDTAQTRRQAALIATVAHELCHERLLGEERIDPGRKDGEPLTDLLTVVLGMGIFTANAALVHAQGAEGWRTRRLGYLTQPMFGHALGLYARLRDEPAPAWVRHLDTNPRAYLKQSLRYLARRTS